MDSLFMYNVTSRRVGVTIVAMEKEQCVLFSTVRVQIVLYCLYFHGYHKSLLQFGLLRPIGCRFYVAFNDVNVRTPCTVVI
jgi:hypothetical protein